RARHRRSSKTPSSAPGTSATRPRKPSPPPPPTTRRPWGRRPPPRRTPVTDRRRGSGARPADEGAGAGVGQLAVGDHRLTRDDRLHVALGPMHETAGPRGQVVHLFGEHQPQALVVDDVEVGALAWRDRPTV